MISESFNTLISSYSEEKEKLFDSLNSFQSMLKEYMVVKENYSKNQGNLTKMHPLKQFEPKRYILLFNSIDVKLEHLLKHFKPITRTEEPNLIDLKS